MQIQKTENAFLVGAIFKGENKADIQDQLNELKYLALTSGAKSAGIDLQNLILPNSATFIGKGKLESIKNKAIELKCNLLIFNNDISPSQLKNVQKIIGDELKVIDRTGLILDIFTKHARTKESKTQVELAQLEYFLPRLTRQWTHLERQMGGVGTRAGAGETQIEVDRRLIRNKISKLKKELKKIQKQRITQNKFREKAFRIALIGYTNAGKSTLMNILTNSNVLAEDKLFATLDTTTRKLPLKVGIPVLISDTVGFIRNLPHNLVASFRSTLKEIQDVDLLIKVIDINSNNINEHINTINNVLSELEVSNKRTLFVFNKIDSLDDKNVLNALKNRYNNALFISSLNNTGINQLKDHIENIITSDYDQDEFYLNYEQSKYLNLIYELTNVLNKKPVKNGILLSVEGSKESLKKITQIINGK